MNWKLSTAFFVALISLCLYESSYAGGSSNKCVDNFCTGSFALRSCRRDLVCNDHFNLDSANIDYVPDSNGQTHTQHAPSDAARTLPYKLTGLHGSWNGGSPSFKVWVKGTNPGLGLAAKFYYDWNGDGSWDRTEFFEITKVPSTGFIEWTQNGNDIVSVAGSGHKSFNNGIFKALFWQPYSTRGRVAIRTDKSYNNEMSLIRIPFSLDYLQCPCGYSTSATSSHVTSANPTTSTGTFTTFFPTAAITTTTSTTTATSTTTSSTTNTGSTTTSGSSTSTTAPSTPVTPTAVV